MMKNNTVINIITALASFLISTLLFFFIAPFIIKKLGTEAYGYISASQNIVNYVSIFTISFTSMTGRFFTVSMRKGNVYEAKEYLNGSFFALLSICIAVSIFVTIITFLNISVIICSSEYFAQVHFLFLCQGIAFVFTAVSSPYAVGPFYCNKLYINNLNAVINNLIRIAIIISLFLIGYANLFVVGASLVFASFSSFLLQYLEFKKMFPRFHMHLRHFRLNKARDLFSLGIWYTLIYGASLLYLQSDMVVANRFLPLVVAGEYAVFVQLSGIVRLLGNSIANIFGPTYFKHYAEENYTELHKYSANAIALTGFLVGPVIGLLGGIGQSFFTLWVGSQFNKYQAILLIICLNLALNVPMTPLFSIIVTYKKLTTPAIVETIVGLVNIGLSVILIRVLAMGFIGLCISGLITYTFINLFFIPFYIRKITGFQLLAYYKVLGRTIFATALCGVVGFLLGLVVPINNWEMFFVNVFVSCTVYLLAIWTFIMTVPEKNILKGNLTWLMKIIGVWHE
jgi:membrane protein EpsK